MANTTLDEFCIRDISIHPSGHGQVSELPLSWRSRFGTNLANFCLAELTGVVVPLLNDYLRAKQWRYDAIGIATAMTGLGLFLAQIPAGMLIDRIRRYRLMLMVSSVTVGFSFGLVPWSSSHPIGLNMALFCAGMGQAFIVPLLGTLALSLAGHQGMSKMIGKTQSWNHAGNIAAALLVMMLVEWRGLEAVFYATTVISFVAAASCLMIQRKELHYHSKPPRKALSWKGILHDRRVIVLLISTAIFHIANAPVLPITVLYLRNLNGTHSQVAGLVLVAQLTMVVVAFLAGRLGHKLGRKPIMAVGFIVLPIRIFAYGFTQDPYVILAIQVLDGIGAGIYGVLIASICADLDNGQGRFNTLMGFATAAFALGGVIGPIAAGLIVQHLGFRLAFDTFAGVALAGAIFFIKAMPETRPARSS